MKNRILIAVDELSEGGYIAKVDEEGCPVTSDTIYGNTLKQIIQRIGKRLEKLIVEED